MGISLPTIEPIGLMNSISTLDYKNLKARFSAGFVSSTWGTANLSGIYPMVVKAPFISTKVGWVNGAVVAGNIDIAVCSISGTTATRLQSLGATATTGTDVPQLATFAYTFTPGLYYVVVACSDALNTLDYTTPGAADQGGVMTLGSGLTAANMPIAASFTVATTIGTTTNPARYLPAIWFVKGWA